MTYNMHMCMFMHMYMCMDMHMYMCMDMGMSHGKGKGKCELDHMFPKKLKSGIKGVTGYRHTLEDLFRE